MTPRRDKRPRLARAQWLAKMRAERERRDAKVLATVHAWGGGMDPDQLRMTPGYLRAARRLAKTGRLVRVRRRDAGVAYMIPDGLNL